VTHIAGTYDTDVLYSSNCHVIPSLKKWLYPFGFPVSAYTSSLLFISGNSDPELRAGKPVISLSKKIQSVITVNYTIHCISPAMAVFYKKRGILILMG